MLRFVNQNQNKKTKKCQKLNMDWKFPAVSTHGDTALENKKIEITSHTAVPEVCGQNTFPSPIQISDENRKL